MHTRFPPRAGQALFRSMAVLAAVLAGCAGDSTGPARVATELVASVEYIGTRAALYIDPGTGTRTRIHFTGATDPIPNNSPLLPPLEDANLLALGPLTWSPDGRRLAMVATLAFDQSELVVMDADGRNARVASVNSQIILGEGDWSVDGNRLLYAMSTRAGATGVELFITDLVANRVQQLTNDGRYRPVGGALRFGAAGTAVYYARTVAEGPAPLFEKQSEIWRLDLATGASTRLAQVTGTVQAIARSGDWALVIRRKAPTTSGVDDHALVRVPVGVGSTEATLVDGGRLYSARLTSDDARAMVVRDESAVPGQTSLAYYTVPATGGALRAVRGTSSATVAAHSWFAR